MTYKRWLLGLVALFSAHSLAEAPSQTGLYFSTGLGVSPAYIEEIITENTLTAGATVTPIHTSFKLSHTFLHDYAVSALAEHNSYIDADSNIYLTGVTGFGVSYYIPDFYQVALTAGVGLASKHILGEQLSSTGVGYFLGISRPVSSTLFVEGSYSYLALGSVASTISSGDQERISSLQLSLSYLWN